VTGASDHDGKIFDQIRPQLHHNELYGDKAYQRPDTDEVRQAQNLTVLTPVKKQKGQLYSQATRSMVVYRSFSRAATN
jgi:hypothetical protein